jgi:hypothetical protein
LAVDCSLLTPASLPIRSAQVKKLDNIIHALECPGDGGVADATRRLETVKRTREVLITDPNSKAHLRVGKLKAVRRRSLGSKSGYGSGGSGSDNSGGTAFGVMRHRQNSSGIDGLLEAATTLSDGETPGTPTREPDAIRDRSPRISGALQALTGGISANDTDTGAGGEAAALALNALKPGGAFQAVRAAVDVANKAAAPAAPVFDANAYAAAMAAFAGHMGNATAAATTPPPAPPNPASPMAALMANPMFAWMAAMGNVAQAQAQAAQAAQAAATPTAPNFLQMAAAAAAAAQAAQPQSAHQPL